ncbi:unnamed protein product [Rotaria magnacalcarata]|uniref:Nuclear pore protein n=1 Tax=Rotaria magnacalcarata TaxID=392030 RepID=A0A816SEX9_9BILA|nr:unnamed protein product [Rotaria magnacalcarata]CAF1407341.1 unnamed protein product [Rotaria magnacalcarata]CAF2084813.1 unnamed protein product [Rotaria magnacalcarata]CAF3757415.1 unnamed protein product [Rotaria magnacalcarata]CAF3792334.1 unnamed protein product [Rotaria magnacalcarata]
MFLSASSTSFNLTSIEKKLAAIESTSSSSSSYTVKPTNRLIKVNNETELDAFLKSERANFNDEQFEYLTQQSLTQADTDYWEEIFLNSLKRRGNLINCLLADDLRPRSISSYDSTSSTKTSQILNDSITSSAGYDFKSGWTSQQNQSSIFTDLSLVEQQYAQKLIKYNQTRTSSGTVDGDQLIVAYKHVAKIYETQVVCDFWHAAEWMTGVLDHDYRKSDLFHSQRAIVLCARDYLEQSFCQALKTTYNDMDFYGCLLSFITSNEKISRLQSVDDRLVDGVSAWPLIFYALRAGDTNLAFNIIHKANLPHVQSLLETYLSKEQSTITNISTTSTTNKSSNIRNIEFSLVGNPYKRAVICILDRTNLVDAHEDVLLCIEDFLWIKLAQIQTINETAFHDRANVQLTIPRLQRWILRDLGEDYFKAYEQPFRYARVLLLCGAFESACEFLFKISSTKVHSIHLSIYFNEKYLLGLTSSIDECMIMIAGNSQQNKTNTALNLPKLIESYLKEKLINNQNRYWELINYAYALINIEHLEAETEFRRLLIDLTTNLDDIYIVYGKWIIVTDNDGGGENRTLKLERGLLHQLLSHIDDVDIDDTLISLATTIEEHHRSHLLVASALFELAHDYSSSLRLASEYMTQLILDRLLIPSSSSSSTLSPFSFVYELAQRLQILSKIKQDDDQQNYFLLLDIYAFVDYYLQVGQDERAFLVLRQLKLFPYDKNYNDDEKARQLFASNKWLQQLFPHLCLAALRTHLLVIQHETSATLTEDEKNQYEFYRPTASSDLNHLAEFAHMQSKSFTRTQLRSIDRLCEQANQYYDQDMSFH